MKTYYIYFIQNGIYRYQNHEKRKVENCHLEIPLTPDSLLEWISTITLKILSFSDSDHHKNMCVAGVSFVSFTHSISS